MALHPIIAQGIATDLDRIEAFIAQVKAEQESHGDHGDQTYIRGASDCLLLIQLMRITLGLQRSKP